MGTDFQKLIRTSEEIEKMRIAGNLASCLLDYLTPFVKPGVSTNYLDKLAYEFILDHKAVPAPLNYQPIASQPPYPKSICTSINHQVCHGVPDDRLLKDTDIVNIDVTVIKDGWYGDTSRMFSLGKPSIAAKRLCELTFNAMWLGILAVKDGAYLGDIGYAIESYASEHNLAVVRDYCGHGIGNSFHHAPQVLHYGKKASGAQIHAGMIFTIEPMLNLGDYRTTVLADKWTVVTKDRSLSAQWEHTVLVTKTGYEVLTRSEGLNSLPSFVAGYVS